MKKLKKLEAFTLIEMLVVMGILVILMTMGIAAGRFAIQRANLVQHQNAATSVYQGLQAYYADNREYPEATGVAGEAFNSFSEALGDTGVLGEYLDSSSFDGGSDATYYYFVDSDHQQTVLVCVTLGGHDDDNENGITCDGNGFDTLPEGGAATVQTKEIEVDGPGYTDVLGSTGSDWDAGLGEWL